MTGKQLLRIFKPTLLINAYKMITGEKKMSESQKRMAYIIEFGSDAMEYNGEDFNDR